MPLQRGVGYARPVSIRDPKKFDPSMAHMLDAPERERILPSGAIVALLQLQGGETVIDYGAGTGRLTVPIAEALSGGGRVTAVDESPPMVQRLRDAIDGRDNAKAILISANRVPVEDGAADRVLAVNLLHEVRGEEALTEMKRLLKPDGTLLIVDWAKGRHREQGPPDGILYSTQEAIAELQAAGFDVELAPIELPFHYALLGRLSGG